jgi:predicted ATPase/DNA-binding CsgD family transcriptional regulator
VNDRGPRDPAGPVNPSIGPTRATRLVSMPFTSFLGREEEIRAILEKIRLPGIRLLTITGPGGIGKTRLALRVMETASGDGTPAVFVSLAAISEPHLIVPAIANALGLQAGSGEVMLDDLCAHLERTTSLIVLDNLDHLLDATAALVSGLLVACPALAVIGTSRQRLNLTAEYVFPLPALDPDTARSLFAARAQAVSPDFAMDKDNAPTIDAICDRIDRLPLAIELAAARVSVLPLPALHDRLERRQDLLTGGPRDAPDRQRTMRAAIAWSYDLLPEHLQTLFRRCGVFVGGFSIEAAGAVAGDRDATLDDIGALVAASLVIPVATASGDPRFTMLETVREFALSRLIDLNEEAATRDALLTHLLGIADHLLTAPTGGELEVWLDRAVVDLANIRAILTWAVVHDPVRAVRLTSALYDLWAYHTGAAEGQFWMDRALATAPHLPPTLRALMLWASGGLARDRRDLTQASEYLTEAVTLAQAVDDTRLFSYCAGLLAETLRDRGLLDLARDAQEVEWRTAETIGEPLALAIATLNRGHASMVEDDMSRAQELFEETIILHRQSGSRLGVAIAQSFLSEAMLDNGNIAGAAERVREAIHGFAGVAAWVQMSSDLIRLAAMATSYVPESSVRIIAAVASIFDTAGITPRPDDLSAFENTTDQARAALGESGFDTAWESGSRLTLDEVFSVVDDAVLALAQPTGSPSHGLSPREVEVLHLVAAGKSNRAIADDLSISERTVENHVFHILTKLEVNSRTAAATWAVRNGVA